ncbi:MAG TPA: hypothetical protein VJZ03_05280 [Candidatus Bathyarchaeia archaeon]|nr:hypothetical protein [Candidatus Bathyarchaeia archaeon]
MALEARKAIERLLKSGPKTGEDLRREYLGARPDTPEGQKAYETKYQAWRRALESLIEEGLVTSPKFQLAGNVVDQKYLIKSIQRYTETQDPTRHRILMEDIEAECRKRDAIFTPRLLLFLKDTLSEESPEIQNLTVSSLSYITSNIDESKRRELKLLQRLRKDYSKRLYELATRGSLESQVQAFELLLLLGEGEVISIIERMVIEYPPNEFNQLKSVFTNRLFQPYDASAYFKNRFLRDHKDKLRDKMIEIKAEDSRVQKRIDYILWHLRFPGGNMPGEHEVT